MEPEDSLPHFQVPTACSYSKPDRASPCPTPHVLKIHLNIILPFTPGSSKWSLSFRFPHENPVYTSPLPRTHYRPRQSHSSRLDHPNNIGWWVHIVKPLNVLFYSLPVTPSLLGPNILLNTLLLLLHEIVFTYFSSSLGIFQCCWWLFHWLFLLHYY